MNFLFDTEHFIGQQITGRSESLLSKDLAQFNDQLSAAVKDKSVLVIGGAGTIGSSYVKAILRYQPAKIIVADINENGLTELVRDCRSRKELTLPADFRTYPINFSDPVFEKLFRSEAPFDIVANFAAHKHVRSEKDMFSIEAMVENNVIKAKKFLDLLLEFTPKHFFCVSTDKAANPVNIMGASKKLMEDVILSYSNDIKITTARFANVAFSNGSLLAGFVERLMKKQPLSSPSDVKRYFISPKESGELCLIACLLGNSGEIIFPKLDPEKDLVSFGEIAKKFLLQLGLEPDICQTEDEAREKAANLNLSSSKKYPLYLFGSDTSGEKLYEEFYTDEETLDLNYFNQLGIVKNAPKRERKDIDEMIASIETLFVGSASKVELVTLFKNFMPNFQHIEKGLNLDQKM